MSTTYRYRACPCCEHPNVHTEKADSLSPWRYRPHYSSQTARPCSGSRTPVAGVPRAYPVARGSPEHLAELRQHQPA